MTPAIVASFSSSDRALREMLGVYARDLAAMVPRIVQAIQVYQGADGKLAQVATSSRFVKSILKEHGGAMTQGLDRFLDGAGRKALEGFSALEGSADLLSVGSRELATVLKANHKDLARQFGPLSKSFQRALKDELATMALVPRSSDLAAKAIAERVGVSAGQAKTIVSTAMASTQRDLHKQALDAMPADKKMLALYIGPMDASTRGFCAALEGKAVRREDLHRLKNGQKGASDVQRYCGGFNCRHRLLPVSEDFVKRRKIPIANAGDIARANAAARG